MSAVTLFEARSYLDDWRDTHEVALIACRRYGNALGEAAMLYSLGSLALGEGNFAQASERLHRAMAMFEKLGNRHGMGLADRNLARIDRVQGRIASADSRYNSALAGLREAGDAVGQAHVLSNIAQIRIDQGRHDEAEELLTSSIEIAHQAGCRRVEAQAHGRLGQCLLDRGDLPEACHAFHMVVTAAREMGDLVGEAYALHGLGIAQLRLGDYAQAELLLGQAHRTAANTRERVLLAHVLLTRGQLCMETGQLTEALRFLTDARNRFDQLDASPWSATARELISRCMQESRDSAARPGRYRGR
jgi:tetratricopeptide (TPR) repeat protein